MGTIATGLKAEQKRPAGEETEKNQKIQERRGHQPGPSHERKGRCYKNINQQVSTASLERRGKETREGERTQELEMVRKNVKEALVRGGCGVFSRNHWEEM